VVGDWILREQELDGIGEYPRLRAPDTRHETVAADIRFVVVETD